MELERLVWNSGGGARALGVGAVGRAVTVLGVKRSGDRVLRVRSSCGNSGRWGVHLGLELGLKLLPGFKVFCTFVSTMETSSQCHR